MRQRSQPMEARENRLLASLAAPDFTLLAGHMVRVSLDPGTVLQQEEAPVQQVYFPLKGAVSLLVVLQSGEEIETAIIGREGAVGLFADFGPWRSCVRAVVQSLGIAESIPLPMFQMVVSQTESIWSTMLRYKESLAAQTQQTAACNVRHSLEQRMARWLLQMSDRIGEAELPFTQETLSQMLGVRRTTVTLAAQKLQRRGLIRYRRGNIQVENRVALCALACECYDTCLRLSDAFMREIDLPKDRQEKVGPQIPSR